MDILRGLTSNCLDVAVQILQRRIKSGDDQDPFRAHSTRDIDDGINNLISTLTNGGNNNNNSTMSHPYDFVFMVLAGERASRISKDSIDELANNQTQGFVQNLEQFMSLRRPAEEKAMTPEGYVGSGKKKGGRSEDDANATTGEGEDKTKRFEAVNTHFDAESMTAIAHRFFAVAVRFYGQWACVLAPRIPSVGRRALYFLNQTIDNWRPSEGHLTPAHAAIVEVALKTHNAFIVSNGRLDEALFEINPNLTGVSIFDYLDFYYFGGLCYASLQRWADAAEMFQQVTLAPARGLSVRAIAAAKAHILVTSILTGDGCLPDGMRLGRYLQELCREYVLFAESVTKAVSSKVFDPNQFDAHLPRDAPVEGLLALCQQALSAIPFHRARNLTRTYLTVSLAALGAECGGSEELAEARVREMVLNKQLECTIDRANKVVTFSDSSNAAGTGSSSSSTGSNSSSNVAGGSSSCYDAKTEEDALRNVMEVNKVIAHRQDMILVSPGHTLAMTGNLPLALEAAKKELEHEKGGLMSAFGVRR